MIDPMTHPIDHCAVCGVVVAPRAHRLCNTCWSLRRELEQVAARDEVPYLTRTWQRTCERCVDPIYEPARQRAYTLRAIVYGIELARREVPFFVRHYGAYLSDPDWPRYLADDE